MSNTKGPKFTKKTICISILLLVIAAVHVIHGLTGHEFQWIWIILCVIAAIGYPVAEYYLTPAAPQPAKDQPYGELLTEEEFAEAAAAADESANDEPAEDSAVAAIEATDEKTGPTSE